MGIAMGPLLGSNCRKQMQNVCRHRYWCWEWTEKCVLKVPWQ